MIVESLNFKLSFLLFRWILNTWQKLTSFFWTLKPKSVAMWVLLNNLEAFENISDTDWAIFKSKIDARRSSRLNKSFFSELFTIQLISGVRFPDWQKPKGVYLLALAENYLQIKNFLQKMLHLRVFRENCEPSHIRNCIELMKIDSSKLFASDMKMFSLHVCNELKILWMAVELRLKNYWNLCCLIRSFQISFFH